MQVHWMLEHVWQTPRQASLGRPLKQAPALSEQGEQAKES